MKLFERLLDSDVKADLLTIFHNNANLSDTPDGLARRLGRSPGEVQRELDDLVGLGILKKVEVYAFGLDRDKEIQDAISKQLAQDEIPGGKIGFTATGDVVPENLQESKVTTGMALIDELLPEGLPPASTILILSDPGSGHENMVAHLVSEQMEAKKSVLYITLDNFPPNIRRNVQPYLTGNRDWASLLFIDCYSKTVGVESEESQSVDPENLSAISIAISDMLTETQISLIVLDSFNTLIRKRGLRSAIEFLRVLVARARQAKCLGLVTMSRKAFPFAFMANAQDVVDAVIELKVEESQDGIEQSLRILKMVGAKHSTAWTRYKVSDDGELEKIVAKRAG
jgi:KaiC/GvpD/RAD55 family RecA-like ATPase